MQITYRILHCFKYAEFTFLNVFLLSASFFELFQNLLNKTILNHNIYYCPDFPQTKRCRIWRGRSSLSPFLLLHPAELRPDDVRARRPPRKRHIFRGSDEEAEPTARPRPDVERNCFVVHQMDGQGSSRRSSLRRTQGRSSKTSQSWISYILSILNDCYIRWVIFVCYYYLDRWRFVRC